MEPGAGERIVIAPSDTLDPRRVVGASGLLKAFNDAGILAASDVHVAMRLAVLGGETDEQVALAAALAVRGPRFGHVRVDLAEAPSALVADTEDLTGAGMSAADVTEAGELPWPEPEAWLESLKSSPLVSAEADAPAGRPLRLIGSSLYLDRYWRDEESVASQLRARSEAGDEISVYGGELEDGLDRLFPTAPEGSPGSLDQRHAAEVAVRRRLCVIAGGPGTGKTTTVAKVIGLLFDQAVATGARRPLVALVAPTGKAAARMQEAVRTAARELRLSEPTCAYLAGAEAMTIHRLLRRRPDSSSRFLHDRYHRLPHDAVIVDEMSMVSLSLMARLLEAVRCDARLVLVGDPEQLASVEAGAVMADIVTPGALTDATVTLRSNFRFSGSLARLSDAVRSGDPDAVVDVLGDPEDGRVTWIDTSGGDEPGHDEAAVGGPEPDVPLSPLRAAVDDFAAQLFAAAAEGDAATATRVLGTFRLLCAHRHGPAGVTTWTEIVERWLASDVEGLVPQPGWYLGRPVMVTTNDYTLRLYNGDTGAVVARPDGSLTAVFDQGGRTLAVSPSRLSDIETVFAMTVHKAQGSEFDRVALVLPPATSPILTRELLYTALTRARTSLLLIGTEESVRTAIERRVSRASGLADRLGL